MNNHKTILSKAIMSAVLGLTATSVSHAGVLYLTGSTAARATVFQAMTTPGAIFTAAPQVTVYSTGTNLAENGATYMAFVGTLVGGSGSTTIDCAWSGSEAGIKDVATGASETFMDPTVLNGLNNGVAAPSSTVSAVVNLAMADNAQAYSRTTTPAVHQQKEVGVVTFKWVRNQGDWNGTNVNDGMIQAALGADCKRAQFTGSSADVNDYVYVTGRNNQSGTRVNAFGDCGYGILNPPNQIEVNSDGSMVQVGGAGSGIYDGDYGNSSGGGVAAALDVNTSSNTPTALDLVNVPVSGTPIVGYSVIGYLGYSDASTALSGGATELTYDGVAFSPANIENGTYTFWGNEYIDEGTSPTSEETLAYGLLDNQTTGISAYGDGEAVISLSAMQATRPGPNTDPVHK